MKKAKRELKLSIAFTEYGWALDSDGERLGLFVTQGQAVASAKQHMKSVKAQGLTGSLTVTGSEIDTGRKRVLPFARFR